MGKWATYARRSSPPLGLQSVVAFTNPFSVEGTHRQDRVWCGSWFDLSVPVTITALAAWIGRTASATGVWHFEIRPDIGGILQPPVAITADLPVPAIPVAKTFTQSPVLSPANLSPGRFWFTTYQSSPGTAQRMNFEMASRPATVPFRSRGISAIFAQVDYRQNDSHRFLIFGSFS